MTSTTPCRRKNAELAWFEPASAYLLQPDLFGGRHINVEIETRSELTMGMTVADWWGVSGRPANALFMRKVDADGFFALLCERLARLP